MGGEHNATGQPPTKQQKRDNTATSTDQEPVGNMANIIIQFVSPEGEPTGPQLDVPSSITPQQCQTLLQGLLEEEEARPYAFYVNDQELGSTLGELVTKHKISVETLLKIVYQPQAVFRVRPVTRCSASIPGHDAAILSVHFSPNGRGLCSGSGDCTVRFWDLGTQTPLYTCTGHKSWVLCVQWSPDACLVASGDKEGALWVWDPKNGTPLGQCKVGFVFSLGSCVRIVLFCPLCCFFWNGCHRHHCCNIWVVCLGT